MIFWKVLKETLSGLAKRRNDEKSPDKDLPKPKIRSVLESSWVRRGLETYRLSGLLSAEQTARERTRLSATDKPTKICRCTVGKDGISMDGFVMAVKL